MEQKMLASLIEQLREFSTPELCDGCAEFQTMDYQIKPFVSEKKIVGPALTVDVPEDDGGFIPTAIEALEPGQVLVIAGKGWLKSSYWGDHRSLCAQMKQAEGVVIDGLFRDLEGCREIGFPVYARGVTPGTAKKKNQGQMNVPVVCGGVTVNPGDIIVGDCNGVLVLRPEKIPFVLEKTRRKVAAQKYTIDKMKQTGEVIPRIIWPDKDKK